jgi:hypothetical protein
MELHPDRNPGPWAKTKFQELAEAYRTLSNAKARSAYDLRYAAREVASETSKPSEPTGYSRCGKATAQPRSTVFTYTVSGVDWAGRVMLLIVVPLILFGIVYSSVGESTHANTPPVPPRQTSPYSDTVAAPISQPAIPSQTSSLAIAKCPVPVQNGEVLVPITPPRSEGHVLHINNGSSGNAIIKARDALVGQLLFAFFAVVSG